MSSTLTGIRGRRVRYDNIAVGSAAGHERTIAGETVSPNEMHGGGTFTSTSTGDVWHSNIAVGVSVSESNANTSVIPENIVVKAEAPGGGENVKVGG